MSPITHPSGQVAVGKCLKDQREDPDAIGDVGVYWDIRTASPGADGWIGLYTTMVDREGTVYLG